MQGMHERHAVSLAALTGTLSSTDLPALIGRRATAVMLSHAELLASALKLTMVIQTLRRQHQDPQSTDQAQRLLTQSRS